MAFETITFESTQQFSPLFLDYINKKSSLNEFYGEYPELAHFKKQIQEKSFDKDKRKNLVAVLKKQYQKIAEHPDLDILLKENTFTVTTGHQLNIFTGPLYIIYKLISTIKLANKLKETYPEFNFVPIYWMATEDHDFEEINHFELFGRTHNWQTQQKGAVGRMNPQEISAIFEEIKDELPLFKKAYLSHNTLSDATRYIYNELFGKYGLVCIDADESELKREFVPYIQHELTQRQSHLLLEKTSLEIQTLGYKPQISAREINLFYLDDQLRERIIFNENQYEVLNTSIKFTENEIVDLIEKHPERFSPNVVLRPVYQEVILPNLAYIGGPAEVNYWLQLKEIFDLHKLPYPIVMPRNTAMFISKNIQKKIDKLCLNAKDFFEDESQLKKDYLAKIADNDFTLENEKEKINAIFETITTKTKQIDSTLEASVNIEKQKIFSAFDVFEKKVKKASERKHETEIAQLQSIKQKLFPGGTPQERKENLLSFLTAAPNFIDDLLEIFDPLNFKYCVVYEENT
ncbi:MAG: bacillithiol biosynthesis cysteine-adding enzyme BshC [Pseudarcicella sp.]|nr:bacillithiol biosynthesis cysteine-adding enzyme BshC [Pseudarcicella sp.]